MGVVTDPTGDSSPAESLSACDGILQRGVVSSRGASDVSTALAEDAGITVGRNGDFTPHVLRQTAVIGTRLTPGTDIVLIAVNLGLSVETARRYALPTEQPRQAAIDRLPIDR